MSPRRISSHVFALSFAAVLVAILAPPRMVQAAAAAAGADSVKAEARERFDRGLGLFEKGDNAAALAEFKRAYDLIANPVVLYNIGLVYAAMYRPIEAMDALDQFLAGASKASADQQRNARKVRDEQAARVALLTVVTERPATIEIDGISAGRTPMAEPLRVVSGSHAITALAPGYQPSRKEVTLAGQVKETLKLTLVPTETGSAHVTIVVPVPGAEVWINGKQEGVTPLPANVAIAPGPVRVEIKRAGYRTTTRDLRVDEGASANLDLPLEEDPTMSASGGRLRVTLAEAGAADIAVDGKPRAMPVEALWLPVGPHILTAARTGFEAYQTNLQIVAGQETALLVALSPTLATRTQREEEGHSRRVLGWSLVGSGVAVAAGAAVYAVVTHHDVADAQAALNLQVGKEADPNELCYFGTGRIQGRYENNHCDIAKAGLQDDLDTTKLRRIVGYAGIGVGVIAAGIGTYLIATASSSHEAAAPATRVSFWQNGDGAGLSLLGRF